MTCHRFVARLLALCPSAQPALNAVHRRPLPGMHNKKRRQAEKDESSLLASRALRNEIWVMRYAQRTGDGTPPSDAAEAAYDPSPVAGVSVAHVFGGSKAESAAFATS